MSEIDVPAEDVDVEKLLRISQCPGPAASRHPLCTRISSCGIRSSCHLHHVSTLPARTARESQTFEFLPRNVAGQHRFDSTPGVQQTYRILANSLLMRFSSSSRARAFLRSAINWTSPRMFALLLLDRPKKPLGPEDDILYEWQKACSPDGLKVSSDLR